MDYFSRRVKLALLNRGSTTNDVIPYLKLMFAKFGIPEEIMSDRGPQFSSLLFKILLSIMNFIVH